MTDPTTEMRRFTLLRTVDHTGVSGVGNVADGVQFRDGTVALRWNGEHSSTVLWASLDDALAVHGHDGATTVHWFDDEQGEPIDPYRRRELAMQSAYGVLASGGDNPDNLRTSEVVELSEWLMHGRAVEATPASFTVKTYGSTPDAIEAIKAARASAVDAFSSSAKPF